MIENAIEAQAEYEDAVREATKNFNKTLAETGKQDWETFEATIGQKRKTFHDSMESLRKHRRRT